MGFTTHPVTTDITRQYCSYIKNLRFEDLPPAIVERAKMNVLHTLGVSLCSKGLQQNRDVVAIAKEFSGGEGKGEATLWCDGSKVSLEAAAFAAGAMADMLDWEDCSWTGHPSAGVIPAAIAGAEAQQKSGKDLLTAVVAGYEIYQRIAMSGRGNIAGLNVFAALVPLLYLFDFDEQKMNRAFGIATACAVIPNNVHENTMSDALNYLYGLRVANAITMVRTAQYGIENMEDAFDDPAAYLLHMATQQPGWFLKDLGEEYLMMDILVKHWPANMFVQTYVELAHCLQQKHNIRPEEIAEIVLTPAVEFRHWYSDNGYQSITQAQFSTPYCVAAVLHHPIPGAVWFQPETMQDPAVVATMNKVRADGFTPPTSIRGLIKGQHPEKKMTIRLNDGTEYTQTTFTHPGHPSYMLTREEFADRFRVETRDIFAPKKTDAAIDLILHLEDVENAAVLSPYLY